MTNRTLLMMGAAQVVFLACHELMAHEVLARWSFERLADATTPEDVSGQPERIVGFHDPADGIGGGAIQLDGYTGYLERTRFGRATSFLPVSVKLFFLRHYPVVTILES